MHSCFSDDFCQGTDENMTRFKRRFSMKQYLHLKPIKYWCQWWFICAAWFTSSGYLHEFDLHLS